MTNPPLDTNSKEILGEIGLLLQNYDNARGQKEIDEAINDGVKAIKILLQTAHNSALDGVRERMPQKITKDITFDPPKEGIITIYKGGQWAKAYNMAIKDCLAILEEMKS